MNKIIKYMKCIIYYIFGNIFLWFFFDKKYLSGRYFEGKMGGVAAPGWKWAFKSGLSRILGFNKEVKWPVSKNVIVTHPENIYFHPDDLHVFWTYGTYFQAIGAKIVLGKGTYIAPNVGLITANHDIYNLDLHSKGKDIVIGEKCWVGMNSVVLPGVHLGNNTIVGAGSVVTKSFMDGNCIIAGNPARIIKRL